MWKLKDVKIVAAEISLINSVSVRIKFSRVLTFRRRVHRRMYETAKMLKLNSCLDEKE